MAEDLEKIIEKIKNRPLTTLNLEDYYDKGERVIFDLKDNLFQGLILREKDFRTFVKEHNWEQYKGKNVAIMCSTDAIIPQWAFMLVAIKLEGIANMICFGDLADLEQKLFDNALSKINPENYKDAKLVIKGCGEIEIPSYAYVEITRLLKPYVFSLFYGEPCSTVPLYKRKA